MCDVFLYARQGRVARFPSVFFTLANGSNSFLFLRWFQRALQYHSQPWNCYAAVAWLNWTRTWPAPSNILMVVCLPVSSSGPFMLQPVRSSPEAAPAIPRPPARASNSTWGYTEKKNIEKRTPSLPCLKSTPGNSLREQERNVMGVRIDCYIVSEMVLYLPKCVVVIPYPRHPLLSLAA